jgi:hypothetical protein
MIHTRNTNGGDGITLQRRQEDTAQSIANGNPVPGLQRFELKRPLKLAGLVHDNLFRFLKNDYGHRDFLIKDRGENC